MCDVPVPLGCAGTDVDGSEEDAEPAPRERRSAREEGVYGGLGLVAGLGIGLGGLARGRPPGGLARLNPPAPAPASAPIGEMLLGDALMLNPAGAAGKDIGLPEAGVSGEGEGSPAREAVDEAAIVGRGESRRREEAEWMEDERVADLKGWIALEWACMEGRRWGNERGPGDDVS